MSTTTGDPEQATEPAPAPEPLLRPSEVADAFGVTTRTILRWAVAGELPTVLTKGGHHRFPASTVAELAALQQVEPPVHLRIVPRPS